MIERISKKYAMTEKGAKDYVAAVFWSVLVTISKMMPVGVMATALSGIVAVSYTHLDVYKRQDLYSVSLDYLLKGEGPMKDYLDYIEESTNTVKSKTRLSRCV